MRDHGLRSLIVVERHPWRDRGGIAMRNAANAAALARLGPCTIVGVGDDAGPHAPSPLGDVGSIGLGHPPAPDPTDAWVRQPDGHPSDARWTDGTERAWRAVLARCRPDVVVVEQLWLHHALPAARDAGAMTVLDAHNVEASVYLAIAQATPPGPLRAIAEAMAVRTARLEASIVRQVDQAWVCSREDGRTLASRGATVRLVPNAVDVDARRLRPDRARDAAIVYPASFAYPPNVAAARTLVDEVLPRVAAALGDARLSLVGRDPPRWLRAVASRDRRVEVTGEVDDTSPWLERASCLVVPLREGGGTRFKVLEAFAAGLPVVSTAKGVEGLDVVPGEHLLVGEDAEELAAAAVRATTGDVTRMVREARGLVERRYSWASVAEAISRHLAAPDVEGWPPLAAVHG